MADFLDPLWSESVEFHARRLPVPVSVPESLHCTAQVHRSSVVRSIISAAICTRPQRPTRYHFFVVGFGLLLILAYCTSHWNQGNMSQGQARQPESNHSPPSRIFLPPLAKPAAGPDAKTGDGTTARSAEKELWSFSGTVPWVCLREIPVHPLLAAQHSITSALGLSRNSSPATRQTSTFETLNTPNNAGTRLPSRSHGQSLQMPPLKAVLAETGISNTWTPTITIIQLQPTSRSPMTSQSASFDRLGPQQA